jgi:2-keto-4-pentenoate hydratase/2-oxohepta-3-ene-1,7-dioic acid hydratase in catechol pathway
LKFVRFSVEDRILDGVQEDAGRIAEITWPGDQRKADLAQKTGNFYKVDDVRLLAPSLPTKVICLGLNYRSHAEEMKFELPKKPIIFLKPSTAVIGPDQPINYPPQSRRVDYESELAVVIGLKAYRIERSKALDYVFGYSCANDVTARDKQPAAGQWTYAKSFDTFCPLGPVVETAIEDPDNLHLKGFLNDKLVQEGSTADHIFKVAEIIEFVAGCMTLLPGDVIITGTPAGIGPLEPCDSFAVTIDKIGTLTNRVVACVFPSAEQLPPIQSD